MTNNNKEELMQECIEDFSKFQSIYYYNYIEFQNLQSSLDIDIVALFLYIKHYLRK